MAASSLPDQGGHYVDEQKKQSNIDMIWQRAVFSHNILQIKNKTQNLYVRLACLSAREKKKDRM